MIAADGLHTLGVTSLPVGPNTFYSYESDQNVFMRYTAIAGKTLGQTRFEAEFLP